MKKVANMVIPSPTSLICHQNRKYTVVTNITVVEKSAT